MQERDSAGDIFSQASALVENACDLQRSFVNEIFDRLNSDDRKDSAVDASTDFFQSLYKGIARNPDKFIDRQVDHWRNQLQLCSNLLQKLLGESVGPLTQPKRDDHRFDDPEWERNALFDYIKQSYLLTSESAMQSITELEGIDPVDRERLNYFMRQLINALAPTNFVLTNPDVLRKTISSKGQNLVEGLRLMAEDKNNSADILNICISKPNAFKVGVNIAHTPGSVVAENELMQLIQYAPTTARVKSLPILIVPSWVNKYYVLDLTERNSFIRWLVAEGYTVFVISWLNPDARHRHIQFFDYMREGPLFAATQIERITGYSKVAGIGYCLGGILLACTLAYEARVSPQRFATATYLAASIDFSNPGDIGIFVNHHLVESIEQRMRRHGYLDGRLLAAGFSLLKENDLYWNYYITNYLKGERPAAFDFLHWNSDNTNIPEATHRFVLRELHLKNLLIEKDAIVINDCPIDLRNIAAPTYVLATDRDHIARWRSCFAA
ncbi:MAG TPA: hypothetical protein VFM32_05445, partial [Spongiibacteraceae bacterium]|nr:hypothetical protein [Spongiibacteraceae bacterium]